MLTDSDWAGDLETRKSTGGGIILLGEHCWKTWSTNQRSPALSSCEAEYCALVYGASGALGMQTAARRLGIMVRDLSGDMMTDASSRRSSGRIRHIEVTWLWLQQEEADGKFCMSKVAGTLNPADILTKYKALRDCEEQTGRVSVHVMAPGCCRGVGIDESGVMAIRGHDAGGPRAVSWADAWEEERQAMELSYVDLWLCR